MIGSPFEAKAVLRTQRQEFVYYAEDTIGGVFDGSNHRIGDLETGIHGH
jgi:hypothetical protein